MTSSSTTESRWHPLAAAVLFAVAFMIGTFAVTVPHFTAPDATWIAFWNDRTHRITEIVTLYANLVAGGALIWFASQLARRAGGRIVYASGWAAAAMLWVSSVLFTAVPAAMSISGSPPPGADVDRITTDMGAAALTIFAVPTAAFLIVVAAVAGLRFGTLPRWLCGVGIPVAIILLVGGPAFIPLPLFPLWVLLAGASMSLRREHRTRPMAAAAAA